MEEHKQFTLTVKLDGSAATRYIVRKMWSSFREQAEKQSVQLGGSVPFLDSATVVNNPPSFDITGRQRNVKSLEATFQCVMTELKKKYCERTVSFC